MPEDLGQEDVVGHVLRLEPVAADGAVGAAQVARFPGKVALAEGDFDLVIEGVLGADMGALGIGVGTEWSGGARKRPERALGQPGRGSGKGQSLCRERSGF